MPWIRLHDGTVAHIRVAKRPRHRCCAPACSIAGTIQCDYLVAKGRTCNAWICAGHATSIGPDLDHCPAHALAQPAGLFTGLLP